MKTTDAKTTSQRITKVTVNLFKKEPTTFEAIGSVRNGDGLTLKLSDGTEKSFSESEIESVSVDNP